MQIDLKDPIQASMVTLVASFTMFTLALWGLKPQWIQRTDDKGNAQLSIPRLITFALSFSLVAAIMALLMTSQKPDRVIIDQSRFAGYYY
jgi:hypothetical protein